MDSNYEMVINDGKPTDDVVVELHSGVPYESYYTRNLPKALTGGLLYQELDSTAIKLANPSPDGPSVDTSLSFMPHYEQLELVDCMNGLLLCECSTNSSLPDISHFIVCNPATLQWTALPETHKEPDFHYVVKLAFDPSWSPYFYVFNFEYKSTGHGMISVSAVEIFSSETSTWYVGDGWAPENGIDINCKPHYFLQGVMYVHTTTDRVLAIDKFHPEEMPPNHRIIELPGYRPNVPFSYLLIGCLGQSSGVLHYAKPEIDGRTIVVWSRDQTNWNMKYRLSMSQAFGRYFFIHKAYEGFWFCHYEVQVVDLDKGLIFLRDWPKNKLLSYCMRTGRLNEIHGGFNRYMLYEPSYYIFGIKKLWSDDNLLES